VNYHLIFGLVLGRLAAMKKNLALKYATFEGAFFMF
jgi:hypothetical protein